MYYNIDELIVGHLFRHRECRKNNFMAECIKVKFPTAVQSVQFDLYIHKNY